MVVYCWWLMSICNVIDSSNKQCNTGGVQLFVRAYQGH